MKLPNSFARFISAAALTLAALATATPAQATPVTVTYNWSGACADCLGGTGTATGQLTLNAPYVLGTAIDFNNFVSFHYNGTNMVPAFTILASDAPALWLQGGLTGPLPGPSAVKFYNPQFEFETGTFTGDGASSWCVSNHPPFGNTTLCNNPGDLGGSSTFSLVATGPAVPEPASLILFSTGLLAIDRVRRRLRG